MQRFKSFMIEQVDPAAAFQKARAVSIYLDGQKKVRFEEAIDLMIKAANDKQIYNSPFQDAYTYGLGRGLEYAWEKCRDLVWNNVRETGDDTIKWDLYSFSNLNGLKKFEKAWLPFKAEYPVQFAFIEAIRDLPDAVKILKTYILKGKPKKEAPPGTFMKPMASRDATVKAVEFLREAVATFKVDYHNAVREQLTADLAKVKALTTPDELKAASTGVKSLAGLMLSIKRKDGKSYFELRSDADEYLIKIINDTVTDVIEGFVAKNTSKLSLIFQKKSEVKSHKINHTYIRNGTLENSMYFEFADSSSFVINSQVVYKWSSVSSKPFMQFPTRFMNVKMADGTKMKMPSEEKMIKEF